ncbi:MAG: hypothetical protein RJB39_77 [Candidatus Parcubacteria bacterium]|jgi:hypothetical protein
MNGIVTFVIPLNPSPFFTMKNRFPYYLVLTVGHTQAREDGIPCRFCMTLTIGTFATDFLIAVSPFGDINDQGVVEPYMHLETSMLERRGLITKAGERFLIDLFRRNIYGKEGVTAAFFPLIEGQSLPLFLPRQFDEVA